MKELISARFGALVAEGDRLVEQLPSDSDGGLEYYVESDTVPEYQMWVSSVANLLDLVASPQSSYLIERDRLLTNKDLSIGLVSTVVQRLHGLLKSAQVEWQTGLLQRIVYIVAAETFDEFLDKAAAYHAGNKKVEAAVLASAVLEDTVKKIAAKNGVETQGKALEQLIDDLVKAQTLTPVKAKHVKSAAAVRNHALHAEWDDFDIKDTGKLIEAVRDLIRDYL